MKILGADLDAPVHHLHEGVHFDAILRAEGILPPQALSACPSGRQIGRSLAAQHKDDAFG